MEEYTATISAKEYKELITENTHFKIMKAGLDKLIKNEILDTLNYYAIDALSLEELDNVFYSAPNQIKQKYFNQWKIDTFIQKFGFVFKDNESMNMKLFRALSEYILETKRAKENVEGIKAA